jgi:hypothetical protein
VAFISVDGDLVDINPRHVKEVNACVAIESTNYSEREILW